MSEEYQQSPISRIFNRDYVKLGNDKSNNQVIVKYMSIRLTANKELVLRESWGEEDQHIEDSQQIQP